ncbi:MAG: hypothetical protein ACI97A_002089 [Planctomycetota bacterium]|jgi:hypothetical protein
MKCSFLLILLFSSVAFGQMEKRVRVLYDREAFRKQSPAVGKLMTNLTLRDLKGRKVSLAILRKTHRLVIIGGAYT